MMVGANNSVSAYVCENRRVAFHSSLGGGEVVALQTHTICSRNLYNEGAFQSLALYLYGLNNMHAVLVL